MQWRVERRLYDQLGLLECIVLTKVPQELKEPNLPCQVECAHATKHPQVRLEQGEQALGPILMHVTTRIFFLRVIDERRHIAFQGPVAAGRVGVKPTARMYRYVRGLLYVHLIWARDYLNTPTDAFIVSEEFYTTRREPLVAFLKAYKRGTQWMLTHPDEAGQLAVKHAIDGKDPQRNLAIIKLRNAATVDEHTRQHGLGWFDITLLEKVERTFRELGLTKNTLEVQRLFTNEFVQAL